jgi:asparagine synthase (glutamine-hydrolysing)
MCGIAGILSFNQNAPATAALLQKMTDAIRHRGPDDEGFYVNGNIALGHRRLAIIDLSPDGHQPMAGPDGSTWIIYNGEIYNYLELRAELSAQGHQFKSQSDTEVILHAYQEHGPDCVRHFNGMFAFAIWDARQRRLFLARDRFGIKPLYFCRTAHQLFFASEIKALLAVMEKRPSPNQQLMYDFLTIGVLDHTNDTFFASVHKLPPAHYMLVDATGREQINRYWDFEVSNEVATLADKTVAEKSQAFFDLFAESIQSHLISDVPVGSCLSGGLDSSAVVSVISRLIREQKATSVGPRQQTFSACYNDSRIDEQPFINHVIQATGALSHRVFPTADGFKKDLPQLLWHQEEPFSGTSMYAQWEVMRCARDDKVPTSNCWVIASSTSSTFSICSATAVPDWVYAKCSNILAPGKS